MIKVAMTREESRKKKKVTEPQIYQIHGLLFLALSGFNDNLIICWI
jgi:hypothetical protein